jgi:lipopolysaccharide export system protein LptA
MNALQRIALGCVLTALGALHGPAQAERADRNQRTELSSTKGAVWDDLKQVQVWTGDVELIRGSTRLAGERLEFRQDPDGYQFGSLVGVAGKPASYRTKRDGLPEFFAGQADRIEFDGKADTIILVGNAVLRRTGTDGGVLDEIRGARIVYNNQLETYAVEGGQPGAGSDGRVRATLSPRGATGPVPQRPATPSTPSSAPGGAQSEKGRP